MIAEFSGLTRFMHTESPKECINPPLFDPRNDKAHPEVCIHHSVLLNLHATDTLEEFFCEDCSGTVYSNGLMLRLQPFRQIVGPPRALNDLAVLSKAEEITREPFAVGMPLELLHNRRDSTMKHDIIRVEPGEVFATSAGEAFVEGIRLALVGLAAPPSQFIGIFPDDLDRVIGGAAVTDDKLVIVARLREDGLDRFVEKAAVVVVGNDN